MRFSAASVRVTIDGNPIPIVTAFEYSGPTHGAMPAVAAPASWEATGYAVFQFSRYWQRRAMWRRRMNNRREARR